MTTYLNSRETLEKMCVLLPDKPLQWSIARTIFGGASLAASSVGTNASFDLLRAMPFLEGERLRAISYALVLGLPSLIAAGVGVYKVVDGLFTWMKPEFCKPDGHIYYRSGGFTDMPSYFDAKERHRVLPIESLDDPHANTNKISGYKFINGLEVMSVSTEELSDDQGTSYYSNLDCHLNDEQLTMNLMTSSDRPVERLDKLSKNGPIYLLWRQGHSGHAKLRFGPAVKADDRQAKLYS